MSLRPRHASMRRASAASATNCRWFYPACGRSAASIRRCCKTPCCGAGNPSAWTAGRTARHFPVWWLHPSRRGQEAAPQDEVSNPHGEERGNAVRLEPCARCMRDHDPTQPENALGTISLFVGLLSFVVVSLADSDQEKAARRLLRRAAGD